MPPWLIFILWELRGPIAFFLGMSSMISQKMVTGKLFGDANKHYIYTSKFVECVFKYADSYKWFPTPTACEKGAYIDECEGVEGCPPLAQNCEVGSMRNQVLQTSNPCQGGCKKQELTGANAPFVSGDCPRSGMQPAHQYDMATFYDGGQIPMFDEFDPVYIIHTIITLMTVAMVLHQLVAFGKQIGFVSSTSEARRLITQKALKINDNVVSSIDEKLTDGTYLLKLGKKKFIKVKITSI